MKLKTLFTLIFAHIYILVTAQEAYKVLPAFESNLKKSFDHKWLLNRYSENVNGIYAEIISNKVCYIIEADKNGNIITKKDFFVIPNTVQEFLNKYAAYKIEDIKIINEKEKALEVIADNKKVVFFLKNNLLERIEELK